MKNDNQSFAPNPNKSLTITVEGKIYYRYPIKTEVFKKGDDITENVKVYVYQLINQLIQNNEDKKYLIGKWFVVISEKIVAIAQGRSYFIKDIKPSFAAKLLSKFVTKTPYGIGLGSPWTMHLAIEEVGLVRILRATLAAAFSRPFGIKGLFYKIVGDTVRAIDGPTEYSLYPSNVSAKLGPKEPEKVAKEIKQSIVKTPRSPTTPLTKRGTKEEYLKGEVFNNFLGAVIIDANDLGQNVLGNSTGLTNSLIEKIFKDNPLGQTNEQTPLVLVVI